MSIPCSFFPFSFFIFIFMHWLLFDAKSFPPRCPPMTTLLPGLSTPRVYSGSGLPDGVSGSSPRVGPCQDAMFSRVSVCNPRLPRNCSHPNNPANVGFAWWWTVWNRPRVSPRNRTTFAPVLVDSKRDRRVHSLCFGYSIPFSLLLKTFAGPLKKKKKLLFFVTLFRPPSKTVTSLSKSPWSSVPQLPGRVPSRGPRLLSRMIVLAGTLLRWVEHPKTEQDHMKQ